MPGRRPLSSKSLLSSCAMPYCPCRHPRQIVQEAAVPSIDRRQPPSHGRDYSIATACSHLLASKCRVQRPMRSVRQRRLKRDNHLADNNLPAASLVSDQTGVSAPWRRGEGRPCRLRLRVTRWNGMDGWMDGRSPSSSAGTSVVWCDCHRTVRGIANSQSLYPDLDSEACLRKRDLLR
jgi:hypothetical protein